MRELQPQQESYDTEILVQRLGDRRVGHVYLDSREMGYLPTCYLTALILAVWLPRTQWIRVFLGGMVLLHAILTLRLLVPVLLLEEPHKPNAAWWLTALDWVSPGSGQHTATGFVASTLIWAGLMLLTGAWRAFFNRDRDPEPGLHRPRKTSPQRSP
jgi:hypothetical protein